MSAGPSSDRRPAPPRLYHHDPRAPFLELVADPLNEKAPKPIRRGWQHWRDHYARRDRQHGELRLRWRGRAKRGEARTQVEHARIRSELQETVARLCMWMLIHCDVRSRWVGKPAGPGEVQPYSLEEIATALRRPGEDRIPLSTLCRALGRVGAAGYVWRWQGRDRELDDEGIEYWRGKVAVMRLTERFWRLSGGAFQIRERWLDKKKRAARRAELEQPSNDFNAFLARYEREHPEISDPWEAHRRARDTWQGRKPPPK